MSSSSSTAAATATAGSATAPKAKKGPPPGLVIPPKAPKLSKAERRALQEQQRAAKAAKQSQQPQQQPQGGGSNSNTAAKKKPQKDATASSTTPPSLVEETTPQQQQQSPQAEATTRTPPRLAMVSHLAPYTAVRDVFVTGPTLRTRITHPSNSAAVPDTTNLHPAVVQLGYQYASGQIRGGNARCRAMLACWQTVLLDFVPPNDKDNNDTSASSSSSSSTHQDWRPVVDALLKTSFQFWTTTCRAHSVTMGNAYTMLKAATAALDRTTSWNDLCDVLLDAMQAYVRERIAYAGQAIADLAGRKVVRSPANHNNSSSSSSSNRTTARQGSTTHHHHTSVAPTILVYGYSEVVSLVLRQAAAQHQAFAVICVDAAPLLEGRRMLDELRTAGVKDCTYILLNALTYVMPHVTTVLVGAAALMSDGAVWNRVGTANVALLAQAHNVPVLVCAESYKISNRVQLEALTHNELGMPPSAAVDTNPPQQDTTSQTNQYLSPINLLYDLTPASFVSGIVTELGIIPPTSVAVLLRELNAQQQQAPPPQSTVT